MISADLALDVAFRLSAAALAIGFLEQLAVFARAFGQSGPFSPVIAEVFGRWGSRAAWLAPGIRLGLTGGAIAGAVAIVAGPYSLAGRICGPAVLACLWLAKVRRVPSSDGAEQMAVMTLVACTVALVPGYNKRTVELATWFVGAQSILSYLTAGVAKAFSTKWRSGVAIPLIMGSESHGQPWVATLLERFPAAGRLMTQSVILFECAFPLVLIGPREFAVAMLVTGFLFHFGCAVTMGLNAFLLAFPGSYLCVAWIAQRVSPFWLQ